MVVVVGAGWAGCAAAYAAATAEAQVVLTEKTDMLLGTGLVGGIMRNNGRYTATEEACALGCSDFFGIIESVTRHRWLDFPGHRHASLYDVTKIEKENTKGKACQQYNMVEYTKNLILLDTGQAKLMTPFFPLEVLRKIKGFEEARYADPYSGGTGNSVRFMAIAPCNNSLKVGGVNNLYCAGEKTGLLVGHAEAIITGFLAGYNAVSYLAGKSL